jgi:hypothetical protein
MTAGRRTAFTTLCLGKDFRRGSAAMHPTRPPVQSRLNENIRGICGPEIGNRHRTETQSRARTYGNFYVYDSIGPIADLLQRQRGLGDTQIGIFNAIYNLPNVVLIDVGGILVDRFGAARMLLWTTAVCLVGAALTALSPSFDGMAAGTRRPSYALANSDRAGRRNVIRVSGPYRPRLTEIGNKASRLAAWAMAATRETQHSQKVSPTLKIDQQINGARSTRPLCLSLSRWNAALRLRQVIPSTC